MPTTWSQRHAGNLEIGRSADSSAFRSL